MTRRAYLDPLRSELVNLAREAVDSDSVTRDDIAITALGWVYLTTASPSAWSYGLDSFDCLIDSVRAWDLRAENDEPWERCIFPEEGIAAVGWKQDRCNLMDTLNLAVDALIFAGQVSHLPMYRVEGDLIVWSET